MAYQAASIPNRFIAGTTIRMAISEVEPYYHPEVGEIRFASEDDRLRFLELIKAMLQERIDKLSLKPDDIIIVENPETVEALVHCTNAKYANPIIVVRDGDVRTMTDEEVRCLIDRIT